MHFRYYQNWPADQRGPGQTRVVGSSTPAVGLDSGSFNLQMIVFELMNFSLVFGLDPTWSMDLEQVDVKHLLEEDPGEEQGESIDGKKNKEGFDEALNLVEAYWDDG